MDPGVLDIESIRVEFSEHVLFSGSRGSAIFATSSQVNVLANTLVQFINNTATDDGAWLYLASLFSNSILTIELSQFCQ